MALVCEANAAYSTLYSVTIKVAINIAYSETQRTVKHSLQWNTAYSETQLTVKHSLLKQYVKHSLQWNIAYSETYSL